MRTQDKDMTWYGTQQFSKKLDMETKKEDNNDTQ